MRRKGNNPSVYNACRDALPCVSPKRTPFARRMLGIVAITPQNETHGRASLQGKNSEGVAADIYRRRMEGRLYKASEKNSVYIW